MIFPSPKPRWVAVRDLDKEEGVPLSQKQIRNLKTRAAQAGVENIFKKNGSILYVDLEGLGRYCTIHGKTAS